nr:IclR family transcriptional regulator [Evansella caseinilytica]
MLKTLDQSLKILLSFTKEKPTWGARELAKQLQLNPTNVYRILATFEKNRFLTKDPETKKYSLGIKLWELGLMAFDGLHISQYIRPILQELMEKTGESVFLTSLDGKEGLTLDVVEPADKVKFSVSVGSRAPLYVGASYRSILAYASEDLIEEVVSGELKAYTPITITSKEVLLNELVLIRKQGWAKSAGEYTRDVIALAVPLFKNGKVIGSLTLSGPTYRMGEESTEKSLSMLMETRDKVASVIGKYELDFDKYLISG